MHKHFYDMTSDIFIYNMINVKYLTPKAIINLANI